MRQRTKIEVPNPDPKASEFENFDRFMRVLITKPHKPEPPAKEEVGKDQEPKRRRLPRP
jgi:hypothetical protein